MTQLRLFDPSSTTSVLGFCGLVRETILGIDQALDDADVRSAVSAALGQPTLEALYSNIERIGGLLDGYEKYRTLEASPRRGTKAQ